MMFQVVIMVCVCGVLYGNNGLYVVFQVVIMVCVCGVSGGNNGVFMWCFRWWFCSCSFQRHRRHLNHN